MLASFSPVPQAPAEPGPAPTPLPFQVHQLHLDPRPPPLSALHRTSTLSLLSSPPHPPWLLTSGRVQWLQHTGFALPTRRCTGAHRDVHVGETRLGLHTLVAQRGTGLRQESSAWQQLGVMYVTTQKCTRVCVCMCVGQ